MGNQIVIPFTEMFERLKGELVRDDATGTVTENKYKSRINDIYLLDMPTKIDWKHTRKTATVTTTADYSTGNISATSGTTITGASTAWTSAISNNMLLKISGYNEVYRMTYVSSTSLTADRAWVGTDISANTSYRLVQDRYALATDFEAMAGDPDKCVYYWEAGVRKFLKALTSDQWDEKFTPTQGVPYWYATVWVGGSPYLYMTPPDDISRTVYYEYTPRLVVLDEYTTGTSSVTVSTTAVTGVSTAFSTYVSSTSEDFYMRWDTDGTASASVWYKISTAGSATAITLASNYLGGTKSGAAHTICRVPIYPPGLHLGILYKAAIISATDQNSIEQVKAWSTFAEDIIGRYASREARLPQNQRMRTIYERAGVRR